MSQSKSSTDSTAEPALPESARQFLHDNPPDTVGGTLGNDQAVLACFHEAINYYHSELQQVHRDKIQLKWGIRRETVDEYNIGFAKEDNNLVQYLLDEGYHPITIAQSGVANSWKLNYLYHKHPEKKYSRDLEEPLCSIAELRQKGEIDPEEIDIKAVYEALEDDGGFDLSNGISNRFIFPYPDEDGIQRYLIGRETMFTDDYGHKYLKHTVKRPFIKTDIIYEPIFGTWTVSEDEPLILTEGITDAIMAHQAGFNCISPVTKHFKDDHYSVLEEYCRQASSVYILNDSEDSGQGAKGGIKTALYLDEQGIDARIGELPRPEGMEKMDMAEFLRGNAAGKLVPILESAVEPEEAPVYDELEKRDIARARGVKASELFDIDDADRTPDDIGNGDGQNKSQLWDLTLDNVCTKSVGRYEHNPLAQEGQSASDYFQISRDNGQLQAYSYKSDQGYNALIWLAVECGTRSPESAGGSFTDEEIWDVWTHAKDKSHLPSDDSIPSRAIWHVCRAYDLAPKDIIPSSWDGPRLPPTIYNRALDKIEDLGYNPGRSRLNTDSE